MESTQLPSASILSPMKSLGIGSASRSKCAPSSLRITLRLRSLSDSPSLAPHKLSTLSCQGEFKARPMSTNHRSRWLNGQLRSFREVMSTAWSPRSPYAKLLLQRVERRLDQWRWTLRSQCIMCRAWQCSTWKLPTLPTARSSIPIGGYATSLSLQATSAVRELNG